MKVLVTGSGLIGSHLKLAELGHESTGDDARIKFLGFVPDEKLVDFLDVFVFLTKIEGCGLPVVEAVACKNIFGYFRR